MSYSTVRCALSRIALLFLPAVFLSACETTVTAKHDPLYRASAHTSTISAEGRNSDVGLDRIDIEVTRGAMTDCTELGSGASLIPCRTGASAVVHTCSYTGSPSSATCDYTFSLGNSEIVTYQATAVPTSGSSRNSRTITYAGGFPPVADIARPIWWHTDAPSGGTDADRIDLGFFPDADYQGLYTSFTDDTQTIIDGAFFNSDQNFAEDWTTFRFLFNLWAGPFGADGNGCSRTFDSDVDPIRGVLDGVAIVHDDNFRDCASITLGGGGAGTVWANAGDPDWILIHEGSHFLLGLGDEYCCDGGYFSISSPKNVLDSSGDCNAAATALGIATSNCTQIATTGKYRIDQGLLETMEDRTDNSDYRNSSDRAVINRFADCIGGSCY